MSSNALEFSVLVSAFRKKFKFMYFSNQTFLNESFTAISIYSHVFFFRLAWSLWPGLQILNKNNNKSGHLHLVPDLREKALKVSTVNTVHYVGWLYMPHVCPYVDIHSFSISAVLIVKDTDFCRMPVLIDVMRYFYLLLCPVTFIDLCMFTYSCVKSRLTITTNPFYCVARQYILGFFESMFILSFVWKYLLSPSMFLTVHYLVRYSWLLSAR